ncbi:uncharacterized protein MJAP1_003212 [Malassezia japonica]|uniref:Uncharacterized protein n=1 Tax=Malassezia japonica TaxID=223818 RepID=A0AAF0F5N9_9BASI|nr:uncharacterized protein MJAP1_003212 [Malassezia japonica]WFD40226.1 hypothetical protein MJAP1_003212 [Malassezia japonica]
MNAGRRYVHTFMETMPKYSYAPTVPPPRRVWLPTRPKPVSQLRTPEQSAKISAMDSIQSILPRSHNQSLSWHARSDPYNEAWSAQHRRATVSATATAVAALGLSLALIFARIDPLHTENAPGAAQLPSPANWHRLARRGAFMQADQIQFVKDAAQIGPI